MIAIVVVRQLVRLDADGFHVLIGHRDARQHPFDYRFVRLENIVPVAASASNLVLVPRGTIGPGDHTIGNAIEDGGLPVVLWKIAAAEPGEVHAAATKAGPLGCAGGIERSVGVVQVIEEGAIGCSRGGGDRHVVRRGKRGGTVWARIVQGDRRGALADARHRSALVDRKDIVVVRGPDVSPLSICGARRCRQLHRGELRDGVGAGDREGLCNRGVRDGGRISSLAGFIVSG